MRNAALALSGLLALSACAHGSTIEVPKSGGASPRAAFGLEIKPPYPVPILALDTSDGTALELETLRVDVTIEGPLAYTKLHAKFKNPSDRTIEGRFHVMLPPRSSVARLGMTIRGEWHEAEAVESVVARKTYEEIMHRRVDPLLVEQPRERELAARLAPIAPREEKRIELELTSEVVPDRPFVIPLRGLPSIHQLEVKVSDGITEALRFETNDWAPTIDVRHTPSKEATARMGNLIALRVKANIAAEPQPLDNTVYLVDTSASADLDNAQLLLHALPPGRIIAYDQTAAFVRLDELGARGALGLANLSVGLELAVGSGARRLVILGGSTEGSPVVPPLFDRVDILGTTPTVDARALRPLAKNGLLIEDAALLERAELVRRLSHRVHDAPVNVPNARWQSTRSLDNAAPGEERVIYAEVPPGQAVGHASDAVEHAAAAAKVESLLAGGESNKPAVVLLAQKHRLITPYTSLLVLESNDDVARLHSNQALTAQPPPSKPAAAHQVKTPQIRAASVVQVNGRVPPEVIQRVVRLHFGAFKACLLDGRRRDPHLVGRVVVKFVIGLDGHVRVAQDGGSEIEDKVAIECMVQSFARLEFPPPEGGILTVVYPIVFAEDDEGRATPPPAHLTPPRMPYFSPFAAPAEPPPPLGPWSASYLEMREARSSVPRTPLGFIALGEVLEARGERERASRAYASLVELWPERLELARAAAVRLDHVNRGDTLALRLLHRAVTERPDQPSSHHLLGLTLLRAGDAAGARAAFQVGAARSYEGRYGFTAELFKQDLALCESIGTARTLLSATWETDTSRLEVFAANDEGARLAASEISLANDGYGPSMTHPFDAPEAMRARVGLSWRGMGGDPIGVVHVIKRNERGDVTVEPRPFEIMIEGSTLDAGRL